MRVAYLTAGAAQMFCGSCLRDNTLAAALNRLGCDVQLIPTYTPIRTDEQDVSLDTLYFGGINVFLQQKFALFRYLPRFLDRPLDSPWLVRKLSARSIETSASLLGELTLSMLRGEKGNQRKEIVRLTEFLRSQIRPELISLTNMLIAGTVPALKRELKVPVVVTLQGDDLFLEDLKEPYHTQALEKLRDLQHHIDCFVVFSEYYADFMASYLAIPKHKFRIVPLGLSLSGFPKRPALVDHNPPVVGYLARVCKEKGFHLFIDACIELSKSRQPAPLFKAAGWLGASDQSFFDSQMERLRAAQADHLFEYVGVPERREKIQFLSGLDVFTVPTTYKEPKGLFALEAMASGIPVVLPDHGAFPELVGATGGGRLFRPDDSRALVDALADLLDRPGTRRDLGECGHRRVRETMSDDVVARSTLEVYRSLAPDQK